MIIPENTVLTLAMLPRFKRGESPRVCIIEGCGKKVHARGVCSAHHQGALRGPAEPRKTTDHVERFHGKYMPITESGCWIWTAGIDTSGYGIHYLNNMKAQGAHRFSYELHIGAIPAGLHVCHRCDVRCCVNPDHLFLGTHADNMADMANKGRAAKKSGADSPKSKLTSAQAEEMRNLSATVPRKELAKMFFVSLSTVGNILRGAANVDNT